MDIQQSVPAEPAIHCIVENHATLMQPKVRARLAARSRWNMHFTTYSLGLWPGQVECFFGLIPIRQSSRLVLFPGKGLVSKIDRSVASYNQAGSPRF